ncbi:MAG: hypothetical protein IJ456_03095, partial [Bacteroides sp.]|nr:hypothetical protein [Bacteroides sp.]
DVHPGSNPKCMGKALTALGVPRVRTCMGSMYRVVLKNERSALLGEGFVDKYFFSVCLAVILRNELVTKLWLQRAFCWLFVASLSFANFR